MSAAPPPPTGYSNPYPSPYYHHAPIPLAPGSSRPPPAPYYGSYPYPVGSAAAAGGNAPVSSSAAAAAATGASTHSSAAGAPPPAGYYHQYPQQPYPHPSAYPPHGQSPYPHPHQPYPMHPSGAGGAAGGGSSGGYQYQTMSYPPPSHAYGNYPPPARLSTQPTIPQQQPSAGAATATAASSSSSSSSSSAAAAASKASSSSSSSSKESKTKKLPKTTPVAKKPLPAGTVMSKIDNKPFAALRATSPNSRYKQVSQWAKLHDAKLMVSDPVINVTADTIKRLNIRELKAAMRIRQLILRGDKELLVSRLKEFLSVDPGGYAEYLRTYVQPTVRKLMDDDDDDGPDLPKPDPSFAAAVEAVAAASGIDAKKEANPGLQPWQFSSGATMSWSLEAARFVERSEVRTLRALDTGRRRVRLGEPVTAATVLEVPADANARLQQVEGWLEARTLASVLVDKRKLKVEPPPPPLTATEDPSVFGPPFTDRAERRGVQKLVPATIMSTVMHKHLRTLNQPQQRWTPAGAATSSAASTAAASTTDNKSDSKSATAASSSAAATATMNGATATPTPTTWLYGIKFSVGSVCPLCSDGPLQACDCQHPYCSFHADDFLPGAVYDTGCVCKIGAGADSPDAIEAAVRYIADPSFVASPPATNAAATAAMTAEPSPAAAAAMMVAAAAAAANAAAAGGGDGSNMVDQ